MRPRRPERTSEPLARGHRVSFVAGVAIAASTLLTVEPGTDVALFAGLLFIGDVRERSGLTALVGWLVGGSLFGGALGYGLTVVVTGVPLATQGGVGLGIALGGGVGVVSNLLAADAGAADDAADTGESVTVDMDAEDAPSPRPADLFDGHPDPVLYVADQGHGPVVLAANDGFGATFDVPVDALSGTPLAEALLATEDAASSADVSTVLDAATAQNQADVVIDCQTPGGATPFRLRTVGGGADGYVLYSAPLNEQ